MLENLNVTNLCRSGKSLFALTSAWHVRGIYLLKQIINTPTDRSYKVDVVLPLFE
jgi:hypothetical protein